MNAEYYAHFLQHRLRPALQKKRHHFLQNTPIILHDNAHCHAAAIVATLFQRWGWEVLYHPPYSPVISPWDYDLFPKIKEPLRGIRFNNICDILTAIDRSIADAARKLAIDGIQNLQYRWQRVIDNAGDYIEGLWKGELHIFIIFHMGGAMWPLFNFQPSYVKQRRSQHRYLWHTTLYFTW